MDTNDSYTNAEMYKVSRSDIATISHSFSVFYNKLATYCKIVRGVAENSGLLGCDNVSPDEWFTIFQKKCSAYVFKSQTIQELQIGFHDPDDEDTTFLQNAGNHSQKDAA
jgi:hypothetical protein